MTLENCAAYCSGYKYFGTEYSQECYCGDAPDKSSTNASLSDCSMICTGNQYEYCGGPDRLELYVANITVPAGPSQPATVPGGWSFLSCYTEGQGTRALSAASYANDSMTLESCAAYCNGYTYFGTEYARECYCGNAFEGGSTVAPSQSDCSYICAGNGSEYCGGSNRLSVYTSKSPSRLF